MSDSFSRYDEAVAIFWHVDELTADERLALDNGAGFTLQQHVKRCGNCKHVCKVNPGQRAYDYLPIRICMLHRIMVVGRNGICPKWEEEDKR